MPRRLLITSALPYVNGHIHLGHLVEYIQTDILVRAHRLMGHEVGYICADDAHGTATMMAARARGVPESAIIAEMGAAHLRDFTDFGIRFDHYGSTDTPTNRDLVGRIWAALRAKGSVRTTQVTQLFDPQAGTFLADRFVKGTCPKCGATDQHGDSCDKCGATYSPSDLKDARSALTGAVPELRQAEHFLVKLEDFRAFIESFVASDALHPDMARWLKGAFLADGEPLRDWDVSRPAPYFGFEIPDAPGHFFYVWLDAPVGYVANTADWCAARADDWARWWRSDDCEIHHVIGKDIAYFHTLFWPAMLHAVGWNLPTRVHIHGFLTVNGEKMSKSKGTFIRARAWLDAGLDAQALRYYYASKLNGTAEDLDLNLDEFAAKANSDLVGKVVNLASRTARFVPTLAGQYPDDGGLFAQAAQESAAIQAAYERLDTGAAMRQIMAAADRANEFVERAAPWALKKDPAKRAELEAACTVALNLFRQLCVHLAPVLPQLAEQAGALLGAPIASFADAQRPLTGSAIHPFRNLMERIDPAKLAALVAAGAEANPAPAVVAPAAPAEALAPTIAFDDFARLDLRVAEVLSAEDVPKARKIVKLRVSLGQLGERTIFAGIKAAFPDVTPLVGRRIVVVANLAPRAMSFGTSEGMVVAAGEGASAFLLTPDAGALPGMRIR